MLPIDIINKILVYVSELNNSMMITQYHPITNKEYYEINFHSDLLWRIKANLMMKWHYPIYSANFAYQANRELYKIGTEHYENQLRSDDDDT
jgi:hypothetical protein